MFDKFKIYDRWCDRRRVIFITSAIFYFTGLFCEIPEPNIATQELATTQFSHLPGFYRMLNSGRKGRFFEMESALCILFDPMSRQDILGFDLEFTFFPNSIPFKLGQETVFLRTTEFDVVTTNFVIECKSSAVPKSGKSLVQFNKEKETLKWARWVAYKMQRGKLCISHIFSSKNINKSVFTLSDFSKKSKMKITFSCSWVMGRSAEACIESLKKVISMLSEKKLFVFFKNPANQDFVRILRENEINFVENIRLPEEILGRLEMR